MNGVRALVFALMLVPLIVSGQLFITAKDTIPAKLLKSDFESLKDAIIDSHPNPFTYCTEEQFEEAFELGLQSIDSGLTKYQFGKICARFLGTMKDSHSSLNYETISKPYQLSGGLYLNLKMFSDNGKYYVQHDFNDILNPGTELISLNGITFDSLYQGTEGLSIQEGDSPIAEQRVNDIFTTKFAGEITTIESENKLVVIKPGKLFADTLSFPGKDYKESKDLKKQNPDPFYLGYDYHFDEANKLAMITIGSFSYKSDRKYGRFLKKCFKKVKKQDIEHLVINLRNNTGGKSLRIETLLSYILNEQPVIPQYIIAKQSQISKKRIERGFKGFNKFFIENLIRKDEDVRHFLTMAQMENGEKDTLFYTEVTPPQKKLLYTNDCYLFVNGRSGSASVNFTSVFKSLNRGPIIGESPMGPMQGTWGNPAPFRMKNSRIEVYISTIRFHMKTENDEYSPYPIEVDYEVKTDPILLEGNKDTQLEFLKENIIGH